jgi:hypothetical protein
MRSADEIRERLAMARERQRRQALLQGDAGAAHSRGYADALEWVLSGGFAELLPDREKLLQYAMTVLAGIAATHRHLVPADLVGDIELEEAPHAHGE